MSILFPAEPRATRRKTVARGKAIERSLSRYIRLDCGHMIARDAAEVYDAWKPPRLPYFCEVCGEYRKLRRKSGKRVYPENPPFLHDSRHTPQPVSLV